MAKSTLAKYSDSKAPFLKMNIGNSAPYLEYSHPQVGDLAWVIKSPFLLTPVKKIIHDTSVETLSNDWSEGRYAGHEPWLRFLKDHPSELEQWLAPRPAKLLGRYFEDLVEFWLRHRFGSKQVISHLLIRNSRRTLGEFDFIFLEKSGRWIHWEVAVKFYLCYGDGTHERNWYGPNPRDRLDLKLNKLFDRQLLLSQSNEAKACLTQNAVDVMHSQAFVKGYLFYPSDINPEQYRFPKRISHEHLKGWWTYQKDRIIPKSHADSRWTVLPRLQWLSPVVLDMNVGADLFDEYSLNTLLDAYRKKKRKPPLIAELISHKNLWVEVSRGFVVPDRWPGTETFS